MKKTIQIELSEDYMKSLTEIAKKNFRSRKSTIEKLVIEYVNDIKEKKHDREKT